ncbi:immunoglobulin-like domain-containing protein [Roseicyclus marinus]|uniref:LapA adhesin domain-containing protein n=1 Tax=Roseicyclus marinus TaxID=2161673 RepID=A0AA48H816_9RHOB|nr:hypothetical protein MACH21_16240 [Roseicyclus marinus]
MTVSITSDGDVTEAQAASFTVSVSQALEDDLVVTLSTGETVTIEAGQTSTTYSVAAQGEDVFADASAVTVSVSGASVAGESFEDLVISPASATVAVSDTIDTTSVTLSAAPVAEGSDITITASVTNAPETDLVLTLSNGETITIGAGQTTGSVSFANPNTDDVYADGGTQSYSVSSTSGGNYEALDIAGASVDVTVTDTIDTVTVSITSDGDVTEAQAASFTVSVSQALEDDLVVTLSTGETVTIEAGQTSTTYSVAAQGEDVFADASAVTVSVSGASVAGESFEDLVIAPASATVAVSDTVDTTTVTLSAAPVAEGSDITITASVTNAPETDLVLTLSNGETITIGAGETTGSVSFANPNTDDVYADGGTQSYSVSATSGGNYEALDIAGASVDVSVTDTIDTTSVTLSAAPVAEGSDITITASVTNAPETDLVLTLSNGETITIGAGETTGSVSFANPNTDDVYADGGTQSYSVSSTSGGNYEALDIAGASVDVAVTDTIDTTSVTLSAAPVAEGSDITITASVTNAPETDLVLTLSNGAEITIGAGQTTGSVSFANPNTDDVYADGGTQSYSVSSTSGGNYEALDLTGASVDVTVTDTIDTTTVTLAAAPVAEGSDITITASVTNAPETDLVLTLSNGETITIGAGETTGSVSFANPNTDDVYADGGTQSYSVSSTSGGNYEALDLTGASVDVTVTDTIDTTTVTLSASPVAEGSDITITASVTNAPETDLVLTLSNGETITIGAGQTTGSVSFANPNTDDVYADGGTQSYSVSSTSGGNYEALDIAGASVDVTVTDTVDTTTVSVTTSDISEDATSVTFDFALSNAPEAGVPASLTVDVGGTEYTVALDASGTGSLTVTGLDNADVYVDEGSITATVTAITGGNFEATSLAGASATAEITDTVDTVTVSITSDGDVTEAQAASFTVSVSEALEDDLVVTLSTGETVTIEAGQTSTTYSVAAQGEDVFADASAVTVSVNGASVAGESFEDLVISPASATVAVSDTIDTTSVTLSAAPVAEGSDITITASVTNAPETDLVLTLSNGETITIGAGETTGSVSFANPNTDDVYADGGTQSYSVSSTSGGNYEALDIAGASVDVTVTDTVDTTSVTLSAAPVAEGSDITITASVTNAPETDLVLTLSNGETIRIGAGQTTGSVSFANPNTDDVYADGGTQSYSVSSTSGGNYEALDIAGASVDVSVTDTIDTTSVTLSAAPVAEGSDITITASVTNAPETDLVLTLSNGETIRIGAGQTTGSVSFANPNTDDVYADGGTQSYSVSSTSGGNYEALDIAGASVDVTVTDTVDTTSVTLSAAPVAEGSDITITASVTDAPETDLVLTLSNGETITIGAGETTGSVSFANPNTDDVYADGGTQSYSVSSTSGGNYEALDLTGASVDVTVTDTIDTTTVTLSASPVAEGSDITITASVTNAPETDLVLTLSNGETITIGAGETTGSVSFANPNTDDVYADGGTQSYSVSSTSGGNYEALDLTGASVDVTVTDTIDTTTVTLSASPVAEGSDITITASVTNAPETDLVLTLSNGETITIGAGQTTGSVSFANPNTDDVYADGGTQSYSVSSTSGGNYEALDIAGASVDVTVTDTIDTVTVSIASDGDVTEAQAASFTVSVSQALEDDLVVTLSTGETVTIEAGQTSTTYSVAAQGEDVFADASAVTVSVNGASVAGESFEDLVISPASATVAVSDTIDTTSVTLSAAPVAEGSDITITASVTDAPETDLVLTLSNGAEITIGAGQTTGSVSFANPNTDDVYADGGTQSYSVSSTSGGNYEALDIAGASVDVTVTDTIDTVTVSIASDGDVTEAQAASFTVSVSQALEDDLVVTLSTGETVTIEAGQTSTTYSVAAQGEDVFADASAVTVSVSGASVAGESFEDLVISPASATVAVSDTIDTTSVTLSAAPVAEGSDITITASVTHAPETDLVLTLSNGAEITIGAGQTTGSVSFTNPNADDVYADGGTQSYSVSATSGGNYEALDIAGASVDVTVTDTIDTVTVSIASDGDVTEAQAASFTVSVSQALEDDLVVTLSTGETVTIEAGETSTSYTVAAQGEDVFADASAVTVSVNGASVAGESFEDLVISPASATVAVSDTIDTTSVTLSAAPVAEGSDITITASVTHAPETDLVLTLSNGAEITIGAGQTTGSVSFTNPNADDVYADGGTQSYSVSATSGGNYEALDIAGASVDVTVTDTIDTVTVSITSDGDVTEAQAASFTVSVSQALEDDLVVTLSTGETVTIEAGQTSTSYSVAAQGEDVFADASAVTVSVSGASVAGESFEDLVISPASATVAVSDTVDTTTVTLSAAPVAEGSDITITASVTDAPETDLVLTLSNGAEITIGAGQTTGSVSFANPNTDDVYADGGTQSYSVSSTSGGNYEALDIAGASVDVTVTDTIDTVTVSIASDGDVTEAQAASFTVSVSQALEDDLVVTLSTGETVTIEAGQTSTTYSVAAQGEDVFADASAVTVSVSGASVAGESFEDLVISPASATVAVSDTIDTTSVTLSAAPVAEGSDITITASVTHAPETDLVLTLSNGAEITIGAGETTGSVSFANPNTDDVYADGGTQSYSVSSTSGGNYEALDIAGASVDVSVTDTVDTTTVSVTTSDISEDATSVTFDFALSNAPEAGAPASLTVDVGGTEYTVALDASGTGSLTVTGLDNADVYVDEGSITATVTAITGGNFEATSLAGASATAEITDTVDTVTVSITSDGDVTEAQAASFTVSVSEALEDDLVVTLSTGETVTIEAGETSTSYTVAAQGEDVFADASAVTVSVNGASVAGESFEDLVISPASATVAVSDTIDTTSVTLSAAPVAEGSDITITASVTHAPETDLVLTLSNGAEITIGAGQTTGSVSFTNPNADDVYADGGTQSYSVSATSGGNYEALDIAGASVDVTVTDTIDTVTVSITSDGDVTEAQAASFTVSVSQALEDDLVVTLSTGETVTIEAGQTSTSYSVAAQGEDVFADASAVTVSVSGASVAGESFEDLVISPASATVAVSDTVDTTTVTLSAAPVAEGSDITITASVTNAPETDLVLTLSNGAEITIGAGETTGSVSFTNPNADDVYADGGTQSYSVSATSGGNYEALDIAGASVDVTVTDTIDTVTVSIASDGDVTEAQAASFTVSVSQALEDDLVVTLSTGETVTIEAGQTSTTYSVAAQGEDVFADASAVTVSVNGASVAGESFEDLVISPASATVAVSDTIDTTSVTLSAAPVAEGSDITITASVTHAPETDLVLTLSNGAEITIGAGQTTGSVSFTNPNADDVYADGGTQSYSVSATSGGNYEALDIAGASVDVTVTDTIDTVTVSIASDGDVTEAQAASFTVSVSQALEDDLVVTLSTGETVTIEAGETSTSYTVAAQGEDVFADASAVTVSVNGASVAGESFEDLVISPASATVAVSDTIDTTSVTLSAAPVAEGSDITITASVTHAPETDLVLTLSNGAEITIGAGQTTGSVSFTNPNADDVYADGGTQSYSVSATSGGNYEALDIAGASVDVTVTDTVDTTTVSVTTSDISEDATSVTFDFALSNAPEAGAPASLTVDVGGTEYTVALDATGAASLTVTGLDNADVYVDEGSITATVTAITGGNFEATSLEGASATAEITDTVDTTTVTLSAAPVAEGSDITITASVTHAPATDLVLTLSNGAEITIGAGETTGSVSFANPNTDDVYADGGTQSYSVSSTSGGNYEALDIAGASVDVTVTDTVDTTTVSVTTSDISEDATSVTFDFALSNAPEAGVPASLTVDVGGTEYTVALDASGAGSLTVTGLDNADVYVDEGSITATVTAITGATSRRRALRGRAPRPRSRIRWTRRR